jgi:phosphodiesterase/alkaline phosphatase D-like protein
LNSKLNREVLEFERGVAAGTHYLSGAGEFYEAVSELEPDAHVHILGGNNISSVVALNESREERRKRLLEATMLRLRKEEEELENSCGTGHV